MKVKAILTALGDRQVLQDIGLQRRAKPFGFFEAIILGSVLQFGREAGVT